MEALTGGKASHTCHLRLPAYLTGSDLDRHRWPRSGGGGEEVSETAWMSALLLSATGLRPRLFFLRMMQEAQLSVELLGSLFRELVGKHPDSLCNNMETADRAMLQRFIHTAEQKKMAAVWKHGQATLLEWWATLTLLSAGPSVCSSFFCSWLWLGDTGEIRLPQGQSNFLWG